MIVLLGVVTLAFFMTHVVPGDPARLIAGPERDRRHGRVHPPHSASIAASGYQYWTYLSALLHGDLGT